MRMKFEKKDVEWSENKHGDWEMHGGEYGGLLARVHKDDRNVWHAYVFPSYSKFNGIQVSYTSARLQGIKVRAFRSWRQLEMDYHEMMQRVERQRGQDGGLVYES